jgi:branched-chain amino acid transport system ATP-binding protein
VGLLQVEGLTKSFGGLMVLKNVSFTLEAGQNIALIGPNGAGKTTLLNVLNGLQPFESGRVFFCGQEITHAAPHKRVSMGIARSFQVNALFPNLSLITNVLLAVQGTRKCRFQMLRPLSAYRENIAKAKELLESAGLWEKRNSMAASLSHGEQRQVEIILALASQPKLTMLDEPSSGLSRSETADFINVVRTLMRDTTIFFSAHDMELMFRLADWVLVLYYGEIIAQGKPEAIQNNAKVKEIYLGGA